MAKFIDEKLFIEELGSQLNAAMIEAAEPLIEEALLKVGREMREQLAKKLLSLIETDYDVMRDGKVVRITIRQAAP
jgi:hypothetical protein